MAMVLELLKESLRVRVEGEYYLSPLSFKSRRTRFRVPSS